MTAISFHLRRLPGLAVDDDDDELEDDDEDYDPDEDDQEEDGEDEDDEDEPETWQVAGRPTRGAPDGASALNVVSRLTSAVNPA